jgi:hypothetical protein
VPALLCPRPAHPQGLRRLPAAPPAPGRWAVRPLLSAVAHPPAALHSLRSGPADPLRRPLRALQATGPSPHRPLRQVWSAGHPDQAAVPGLPGARLRARRVVCGVSVLDRAGWWPLPAVPTVRLEASARRVPLVRAAGAVGGGWPLPAVPGRQPRHQHRPHSPGRRAAVHGGRHPDSGLALPAGAVAAGADRRIRPAAAVQNRRHPDRCSSQPRPASPAAAGRPPPPQRAPAAAGRRGRLRAGARLVAEHPAARAAQPGRPARQPANAHLAAGGRRGPPVPPRAAPDRPAGGGVLGRPGPGPPRRARHPGPLARPPASAAARPHPGRGPDLDPGPARPRPPSGPAPPGRHHPGLSARGLSRAGRLVGPLPVAAPGHHQGRHRPARAAGRADPQADPGGPALAVSDPQGPPADLHQPQPTA